jgi:hypothetical protein
MGGGHFNTKLPEPGTTILTSLAQFVAKPSSQSTIPYSMHARKCAKTNTKRINCKRRRCPGLIDSASCSMGSMNPNCQHARRATLSNHWIQYNTIQYNTIQSLKMTMDPMTVLSNRGVQNLCRKVLAICPFCTRIQTILNKGGGFATRDSSQNGCRT